MSETLITCCVAPANGSTSSWVTRKHPSLIAFSTQPGNVAEDGGGDYSPFTAAFLDNGFKLGTDLQTALMKVTREVSEKI